MLSVTYFRWSWPSCAKRPPRVTNECATHRSSESIPRDLLADHFQPTLRSHFQLAFCRHSQLYRLTVELLAQLPELIAHLNVAEQDLDALLGGALPLLHRTRHRPNVQRAAREYLQAVGAVRRDAGAVYAKLAQLAERAPGEDDAMAANALQVLRSAGLLCVVVR